MSKKTIKEQINFQVAEENIFALVLDDNKKVNICLGGYKVSQKTFKTYEEANNYIATKPYELLINICAVILTKQKNEEIKKEITKD